MNKKSSFIPPLGNPSIINNKNNQIPHPKNSSQISNPIIRYQKRDIKKINHKNNSYYTNENNNNRNYNSNYTAINFHLNTNPNHTNNNISQNRDNIISNIAINMNLDSEENNFSKNLNYENKKNNINDKGIKNILENDLLKEKLEKAKNDMDNIKINIEKLNKKMIDMKEKLDKLKMEKVEKKKEIDNFISNKETLEEMYNMEILFMKNGSIHQNEKDINNCNINISTEEITKIDFNKFKIQIIELIKTLFNNNIDNSFNEYISQKIFQAFKIFNLNLQNTLNSQDELISQFFNNVSKIISKNNRNKFSISSIGSLLHYLIKINCINQKIESSKIYIKNNYKLKKNEINEQLIEITMSLIFFENEKQKILNLIKKLKEEEVKLSKEKENDIQINFDNKINNKEIDLRNRKTKDIKIYKNKIINKHFNKIINKNTSIEDTDNITNTKIEKDIYLNFKNDNKNNSKENISPINKKDEIKDNNESRNKLNGGNIEIRYDSNLNQNIFSEREEAKNKIYENYINNGIVLNDQKKQRIKKYKYNYSISGNTIKEKDKFINDKKNYSTSLNYNFNTNFIDLKLNRKNNSNLPEYEKRNFFLLQNTFYSNGSKFMLNNKKQKSNFNINRNKKFIHNRNENQNNFMFNKINKTKNLEHKSFMHENKRFTKNISNDFKKINIGNKNFTSQSKLRINKTHLRNSESLLTNYKIRNNHRLSNLQKNLGKSTTNSSFDLRENYKSMNNIINNKANLYNNDIFNSFHHSKLKHISNILLSDLDENNFMNYNKSKTNRNTYLNTRNNKDNQKMNNNSMNSNNVLSNKRKVRKLSNLYYERKRILKLSNSNCNTLNTMENRINGLYSINSDLNNQLKIFKQGEMESFCFFKILDKSLNNYNLKKYNPLNDCYINPEYFDYNECYISIDVSSGCLKISPKISFDKFKYVPINNDYITIINNLEKEFYINIKLKEIFSVYIGRYMKNVMKIQNLLLKYNKDINKKTNNYRENKIFSINKLMNKKEIQEIKIEKNEKIKAALCSFFLFTFSLGTKRKSSSQIKIDLIFINYEQFIIWLNTLDSIAKNNIKSGKINLLSNKNFSSLQKLKLKSINKPKKKNNESNFKKMFNISLGNEKIRANSNIQNNNILKSFEKNK